METERVPWHKGVAKQCECVLCVSVCVYVRAACPCLLCVPLAVVRVDGVPSRCGAGRVFIAWLCSTGLRFSPGATIVLCMCVLAVAFGFSSSGGVDIPPSQKDVAQCRSSRGEQTQSLVGQWQLQARGRLEPAEGYTQMTAISQRQLRHCSHSLLPQRQKRGDGRS